MIFPTAPRRRWRLAFAGVCLSLVAACSSTGAVSSGADAPSGSTRAAATSTSTTIAVPTEYAVGTREETYVDRSRPTRDNGSFAGAPDRTLRTRFYYPAEGTPSAAPTPDAPPAKAGAPFPTILFSHGVGAVPEVYALLLKDFAAHGYVVAAPAYPLSNHASPGGATILDVGQQAGDASFVLDQVLDPAKTKGTWLAGLADPERVAAVGHSLGGITTYGLVYNSCCVDTRVRAAVVLSGATVGFPGTWFTGITTPLLHIHGDADQTVKYGFGTAAYKNANAPKYFITILGGRHSTEEIGGDSVGQRAVEDAALDFLAAYVLGDTSKLADIDRAGNIPGVTTLQHTP